MHRYWVEVQGWIEIGADECSDSLVRALDEGDVVTITTYYRTYTVNVRDVDDGETEESKRILKKMNYDGRFRLRIA